MHMNVSDVWAAQPSKHCLRSEDLHFSINLFHEEHWSLYASIILLWANDGWPGWVHGENGGIYITCFLCTVPRAVTCLPTVPIAPRVESLIHTYIVCQNTSF